MESHHRAELAHGDHEPRIFGPRRSRSSQSVAIKGVRSFLSVTSVHSVATSPLALPLFSVAWWRFMERNDFQSPDTHWGHEPRGGGRARSPSAPMRECGALGEVALPRKGRGSWVEAISKFWTRIGTMNQEGTVLSQRDRTHLDWIWIQSGGPRRAATRCAGFVGSWRASSSFWNCTRTMNRGGVPSP